MQPLFQPQPPQCPTKIVVREHAIGNCLAVLGGLNPYLSNGGAFVNGVGATPGTLPTVENAVVKKYAGETAIKALSRLNSILEDDKLWDGKDITRMQNMALKAVSASLKAQGPQAPVPLPTWSPAP